VVGEGDDPSFPQGTERRVLDRKTRRLVDDMEDLDADDMTVAGEPQLQRS
jgi:hypothetical protein